MNWFFNSRARAAFMPVELLIAVIILTAFAAPPLRAAALTACLGDTITVTACSSTGTQPPVVVTPPSPPPAPPPASGATSAACGVTGQVYTQTMNWTAPTRLYQSMNPDDAFVIAFTTGSVSSAQSLPRIAAAEYGSPPSPRLATLSAKACDFGPQPSLGAAGEGNSVTMVFALGSGNGFGYYPVLPLNTTYYLNVKNSPSSTCRSTGSCTMFIDLVKPGLLAAAPGTVNRELEALKAHASKSLAMCLSTPKEQQAGCFARSNGQIDAIIQSSH